MSKENITQGIITLITASISAYFGIIVIPLIVLTLVMVIDYITGMAAAYVNAELSSRKGIRGIFKKLGYYSLVCVGITLDYILSSGLAQIGINNGTNILFGLIVTVWLIINELISILENLSRLDVPIPKFLKSVVERLKNNVDDKIK